MISDQDGKCAICGEAVDRPVVDHDHATGKVRGILCHRCNLSLGLVEKAGWLSLALAYLERTRS